MPRVRPHCGTLIFCKLQVIVDSSSTCTVQEDYQGVFRVLIEILRHEEPVGYLDARFRIFEHEGGEIVYDVSFDPFCLHDEWFNFLFSCIYNRNQLSDRVVDSKSLLREVLGSYS